MARTILLADDSVTIRRVVELTFSDSDIRVESVGSGSEALERLHTLSPDLVLADVVMPEPSGYDICRTIKESERPVPVVLLSGTFEPFDVERATACGADAHLVKPFESDVLVQKVHGLLARPPAPEPAAAPQRPAADGDHGEVEEVLDDLASAGPGSDTAGEQAETAAGVAIDGEPDADADAGPVPVTIADAGARATGAAPVPPPSADSAPPAAASLTEAQLEAVSRAVVERLSDRVLREIAWEVVPELAETIIRERIRQLEKEASD